MDQNDIEEKDSYIDDKGDSGSGKKTAVHFVCPKCGEVPGDEVIFLCNTCGPKEMLKKDGMYFCPQCLEPGHNFQCFLCGSTEVEMRGGIPSEHKH